MAIKVLHVTFNMGIGGTEQVIRQLVTGSNALGIQSEILCIDGHIGAVGELLQEQGIPIHAVARKPGFDLGLVRAVRDHIKMRDIDIAHCHQYTPYLYGFLGAMGTRAKVVMTEHGRFHPDRYRRKAMFVNPVIALCTPAIVAISDATRYALSRYEYMPLGKIQVIYNGIQGLEYNAEAVAQVREQFGIPSDAYVVGTVSRLDPVKNQPMMLRAFKRFLQGAPNAWLLMVGDGPDRAALEALAQELGINSRVIFTGFKTKPVDFLAALDLFLLSSFTEGTSMTLLEAMSLGIPAVVTDVGGNPEIVEQGLTGLLTPSDDDRAFADAMMSLYRAPERASVMSKECRKRFEQRFSAATMAGQYRDLYNRVLNV